MSPNRNSPGRSLPDLMIGNPNPLAVKWAALRFQHTTAIRSRLMETYAAATINRILSALRGTLKAAWRLEQMTAEDYHRAVDIKSATSSTLPAGRELTPGEVAALMQACENDPTPAGARDAAIIALMYASGLRREEVVALSLASYATESGKLVLHGKRNKQRAMQEAYRILRPGGELHIVDFGKPRSLYARLVAPIMGRLEEADDNIQGLLLGIIQRAGFNVVDETAQYTTIVGDLSMLRAKK